jgi:thioredoxin reductase
MLGRCRRRVLVCDVGPRNRRSRALHGFLTRDGIAPGSLNDLGRAELADYGVTFQCVGVTAVGREGDGYRVSLANGGEEQARYLLLATGVVDDLPAIAGFDECYGRTIFHCPYCDAWEWRDRRLAAFGRGGAAAGLALGLQTWSPDVVAFTHGRAPDQRTRERLALNGIAAHAGQVAAIEHRDGEMTAVTLTSGESIARDACSSRPISIRNRRWRSHSAAR